MVPYGEWTEVRSSVEGHFLERFAAGSLGAALRERGARIRVLFQHGTDRLGRHPCFRRGATPATLPVVASVAAPPSTLEGGLTLDELATRLGRFAHPDVLGIVLAKEVRASAPRMMTIHPRVGLTMRTR
jgi:hypothetical protein